MLKYIKYIFYKFYCFSERITFQKTHNDPENESDILALVFIFCFQMGTIIALYFLIFDILIILNIPITEESIDLTVNIFIGITVIIFNFNFFFYSIFDRYVKINKEFDLAGGKSFNKKRGNILIVLFMLCPVVLLLLHWLFLWNNS